MAGQQTTLEMPEGPASNGSSSRAGDRRRRTYNFDYSYWTAGDPADPAYASQWVVFNDIGKAVLDHALSGYHCCVFAYGQTGSGKSYTMMGGPRDDAGLIPRVCKELFRSTASSGAAGGDGAPSYHVEVSYLEIYNERVRDLLNPRSSGSLRVREHPSLGPYVEDLTKAAVSSYEEVLEHMSQGNKARTVAATNMNEASSRSHAVFTIVLTRRTHSRSLDQISERTSRISLVDLAGSERANATKATGVRLKEGSKINQSLAALGKVISALADREKQQAGAGKNRGRRENYVPYRDSVLTWLLKDSLGGNSRTFMIATISPADYSETLSTLRYADCAKHIVNQATVNEDATVKLVRELKEEVASLRRRLAMAGPNNSQGSDLQDQLEANEKLIHELNQTWEEKLRRTQAIQMERERALAALGISIDTNRAGYGVGLHAPRDIPHLVNLSEDPLMSECLVYNLKPGRTTVGADGEATEGGDTDIKLSASGGVSRHHCSFDYDVSSGAVTVHPLDGNLVLVNGQRIDQPRQLKSGYRVIIGNSFVFRLNHPVQARQERMKQGAARQHAKLPPDGGSGDATTDEATARSAGYASGSHSVPSGGDLEDRYTGDTPASDVYETQSEYAADWHYAWQEAHPDDLESEHPYDGDMVDHDALYEQPGFPTSGWSDTHSDISDRDGSTSGRRPSLASLFRPNDTAVAPGSPGFAGSRLAHLHGHDSTLRRPSSQLALSRSAMPISRRRDSAASGAGAATVAAATAIPGSSYDPRRARGLTVSAASAFWGSSTGACQQNSFPSTPTKSQYLGQNLPQLGQHADAALARYAATMSSRERRFYEHRLARLVIGRWRRYKLVRVGEMMLRNAIHLKEANVISKELGQRVVYQFAILRGGADSFPVSPLEPDALPALLSEWDSISAGGGGAAGARQVKLLSSPISERTVPEVVVKVLDIAHKCWYVWSLETFRAQLDKMQRLSTVKGSYRAHLVLDPFHTCPSPRYSCIGMAMYPVWPSARPYSSKIDAPVIDALCGLERGRVTGSLAALPVRKPTQSSGAEVWNVIIQVNFLHGVSESEVTGVHCRLRMVRARGLLSTSSPGRLLVTPLMNSKEVEGRDVAGDTNSDDATNGMDSEVTVSTLSSQAARHNSPLSGFGDGPVNVNFRQQWQVDMLTADTCVVIEFFGLAQPLSLRRAFQEDVQIETSLRAGSRITGSSSSIGRVPALMGDNSLSASQNLLVERLHEEELFVDSQHEVMLWINVLELGLNGEWEKAPCIRSQPSPAYILRQGLQRRIEVVLGHNASHHLRIKHLREVRIGCPDLVDDKGRLVSEQQQQQQHGGGACARMVELPVGDVALADHDERLDNRCFVRAAMPWDTSIYGSRLLDMPTDRGQRVRLSLDLKLELENCSAPLELSSEIFAQIHSRQSTVGRSWLSNLAESASGFFRSGMSISRISSEFLPTAADSSDGASSDTNPPLGDPVFRVFSLTLSPANPARGRDNLWRLNTGKKYVRGEETLLPWQPRSVQFVDEFHRLEHAEAWRLTVARTREQIEALGPALVVPSPEHVEALSRALDAPQSAPTTATDCAHGLGDLNRVDQSLKQVRIRKRVVEAVKKIMDFRRIPESGLELHQEPLEDSIIGSGGISPAAKGGLSSLHGARTRPLRRPANVRPIHLQGHFSHSGWVDILDTNAGPDIWTRRWLVVERPYIFVFTGKSCQLLDNVINISSARIDSDPNVSEMLGRSNVLALYTNTNAYLLNPPAAEVQTWISAIDEWYFLL
ncbi:kinesin-domain-containing protein [Martensiomyces pterosporus]|nr:kinesin-domain-containing protein [Martensiomyces pterosporus]